MDRRASLLLRETRPPLLLGLVVAIGSIAAVTALIYPLARIMPEVSAGVLYLPAVLAVSAYWGVRLGLLTSLLSAAAFNVFHIPPYGRITIAEAQNAIALVVFIVAAILVSSVAELARGRAEEAERRRAEADLAAELARLLLSGASVHAALGPTARRLAGALDLSSVTIELADAAPGPRQLALPLGVGPDRAATLLVPATIQPATMERLRERVLPSLEALLAAALDREALQAEVVETQALRRSDSVKTALLRSVSHDLRTPLTAIVAASAAVDSPSATAEERREIAEGIGHEAQRLSRMVDQLLDLSRLEAGTARPRREWCSLEEVIRAAVDDAGNGADGFELSIRPGIPLINADAAQLERALANLLENAGRYGAGYPVKVRAGLVADRITIRIVDRGPGIPSRELERIFEPFYRAGNGGEHPGSGLGLAIARGLVEANGGRLTAESLPGQGTTFVVDLPRGPSPRPTDGGAGR